MKKILAIAVIVITSLSSAQAQEGIRLGAKGSFFSTWLFNKNVSDRNASLDYASSFSPTFGVQAIFMFKETMGVSAEIIYASQKQKYDGYNDGNENRTFTNELNLSYIDIPILFRVSSPKGPYFEIGPQASLLMGAKETYSEIFDATDNYSDKDVKDDFAGFGVAGVLGFGIDIKLTDMINLTTGLRFGYMFTDATNEYDITELVTRSFADQLSNVSGSSHFDTDNKLAYQKSDRAFGGLQIGVQIVLGK
ncbi:MAG: porin family protein [Bacteroidia bacterium]